MSFAQNGNATALPIGRRSGPPLRPDSVLLGTKNTGGLGARGRREEAAESVGNAWCTQAPRASHTRSGGASKAAGTRTGTNNRRKRGGRGEAWEWGGLLSQLPTGRSPQDRRASSGKGRPGLCPAGGPPHNTPVPCPPQRFCFYFGKMQRNKASVRAWKFTGGPRRAVSDTGTEGLGLPSTPRPSQAHS